MHIFFPDPRRGAGRWLIRKIHYKIYKIVDISVTNWEIVDKSQFNLTTKMIDSLVQVSQLFKKLLKTIIKFNQR